MLVDDRASNLLFLLSLPLAVGCATGDESDATSLPPVVDPTTDGGGDDPEPTTSEPVDGTDGNTSSADGPGMTTDAPPGTTTDEPYGYTTGYVEPTGGYDCPGTMPPMVGPISPSCSQYAAVTNECYFGGEPGCLPVAEAYCQYALDYNASMYGPACGQAYEEMFVCLSQLTCELLTDDMPDCVEQFAVIDTACP